HLAALQDQLHLREERSRSAPARRDRQLRRRDARDRAARSARHVPRRGGHRSAQVPARRRRGEGAAAMRSRVLILALVICGCDAGTETMGTIMQTPPKFTSAQALTLQPVDWN